MSRLGSSRTSDLGVWTSDFFMKVQEIERMIRNNFPNMKDEDVTSRAWRLA